MHTPGITAMEIYLVISGPGLPSIKNGTHSTKKPILKYDSSINVLDNERINNIYYSSKSRWTKYQQLCLVIDQDVFLLTISNLETFLRELKPE